FPARSDAETDSPRALLVELNRGEELIEVLLVLRDRPGRPGELEEQRATRTFDDGTEETVAWHGLRRGHTRPAHAGVSALAVDHDDGHPAHNALLDGCGRRLPIGSLHLCLPALDVGLDAAPLAWTEVVHDAFSNTPIAGTGTDRVRRGAHRARCLGF